MNGEGGVYGLITARGGSKGLPGKHLRVLGGRSLIGWTVEAGLVCRRLERLLVSTDSMEIAREALDLGAEVPFLRPGHLAEDDTPHADVLVHFLEWMKRWDRVPDWLVLLQPTSPFRTPEDIDGAVDLATSRRTPVASVTEAQDHPYLVKRLGDAGVLESFVEPDMAYPRRQDLPPAYVFNGAVYVIRVESFLRDRQAVPPGTLGYVMPPERSLDIDTPRDWDEAERRIAGLREEA